MGVFPLEFNHTGIFNYPVCVKSKWKPGSMFMYEIPKNAKLKTSEL